MKSWKYRCLESPGIQLWLSFSFLESCSKGLILYYSSDPGSDMSCGALGLLGGRAGSSHQLQSEPLSTLFQYCVSVYSFT